MLKVIVDGNHIVDLARCKLIIPDEAIEGTVSSGKQPCKTGENDVLCMQDLDNCIHSPENGHIEEGDTDMSKYKIRRIVVVDGKRREITANTEQEYAEKLVGLFSGKTADEAPGQTQETAEAPVNTNKHLFRDYAKYWYDVFVLPNVSTASHRSYLSQLRANILPVIGDKYIEDIGVGDLQLIFNKMGTECTKASKEKCRIPLRQIFNCAIEDGIITANPAISHRLKVKGAASKETEAYTVEEMRFLAANLGKIHDPTDRIWLALSMFHPLRPEEVLGLKYKDIDRENMLIHVCRAVTHPSRNTPEIKDTKTAGSHRKLSLVPRVLDYLPEGDPEDFIVGGKSPVSYTTIRHMRTRVKKDTGFDGEIMPRRFRCTVLTDIYDNTKDVKQVQLAAGHTTAAMTLKHYVKGRTQADDSAKVISNLYNSEAV